MLTRLDARIENQKINGNKKWNILYLASKFVDKRPDFSPVSFYDATWNGKKAIKQRITCGEN